MDWNSLTDDEKYIINVFEIMDWNILTDEEKDIMNKGLKIQKKNTEIVLKRNKIQKEENKKRKAKEYREKKQREKIEERKKQQEEECKRQQDNINNIRKFDEFFENYNVFKTKFYIKFNILKNLRSNFEDTKNIESDIIKFSHQFKKDCIHPEEFKQILLQRQYHYGDQGGYSKGGYNCDVCGLCYKSSCEFSNNNNILDYLEFKSDKSKIIYTLPIMDC